MLNPGRFIRNFLLTSVSLFVILVAAFSCGEELSPLPQPTGVIDSPAGDSFFIQITPPFTSADGVDFNDLTDIIVSNSNASVFIVDRGNNRVVEIDRGGRIQK